MRADICEPSDTQRLALLRQALDSLGAESINDSDAAIGVRMTEMRVLNEPLWVFYDAWSVDIESSPAIVNAVLSKMNETR